MDIQNSWININNIEISGKPLEKLIETVAKGIGVYYEPTKRKKDF
jgi:hypothetical protein